ncbi:MAG: hypothetical protein AUG75_16040 [Cyanobacteria bacterium 13_1_20CM_4_61_6]|nr:MAG: hypothetical protein AUG75_16040 [Cyanobacteria bacterium 13_1_20CM_4_61_6]
MPWSLLPAKDFGAVADCGSRLIRLHQKPLMMHEGVMAVAAGVDRGFRKFSCDWSLNINPQLTSHFFASGRELAWSPKKLRLPSRPGSRHL